LIFLYFILRIKEIDEILDEQIIDINKLRSFIHSGLPHCKHYRPTCWKLLFKYLPTNKSNWEQHLTRQRNNYKNLITEMVIPPGEKNIDLSLDHPLSDRTDSTWSTFFHDNETFLLQIDRDVRRLLPDISFFQEPTKYPCELVVNGDSDIRLHSRVAPSMLSSANVERKGLGITKVSFSIKFEFFSYFPSLTQQLY
jgi:TBC1 domain family member 13